MEILRIKIAKIFGCVRWWEWTYLFMAFATLLILGIVFKGSVSSILFSLLKVITIFTLGKGWFWGNVFGAVANVFYVIIDFQNHLYGEVIMALGFAIPAYLLSIYTWFKNTQKKSAIVKADKRISWREWVIACSCIAILSVGIYYLLGSFGTAFLLVSTFSTAFCILARYMQVRCSGFNFLCYFAAYLIEVVLWTCVTTTDFSCITTTITFVVQALMNVFAFANWIRMRKAQSRDESFDIIKKCCLKNL